MYAGGEGECSLGSDEVFGVGFVRPRSHWIGRPGMVKFDI